MDEKSEGMFVVSDGLSIAAMDRICEKTGARAHSSPAGMGSPTPSVTMLPESSILTTNVSDPPGDTRYSNNRFTAASNLAS